MKIPLSSKFLISLHGNLKRSSYLSAYIKFVKLLNSSKDEVTAYQLEKLKKLLLHAYSTTLFYKKRFDEAGFNPSVINYPDEIEKLPQLTKQDIKHNSDGLLSSLFSKEKLTSSSSSGSTGEPVKIYRDKKAAGIDVAARYAGYTFAGYFPGKKILTVWGNPTLVKNEWTKKSSKIKSYLFNEIKVPAYKLTEEKQFRITLDSIKKNKPEYIYGYTGAIYLLAEYCLKNDFRISGINGIITTAENLHPYQRKIIEKAFGEVFDEYGCSEINAIGYQGKDKSYYNVFDPHILLQYSKEALDENNSRELLITDLDNYGMPLIRYKNGDLGIPYNEGNSPLNRLKSIEGRKTDLLETPDGGFLLIPSFFGSKLLAGVSFIKQYKVVKETTKLLTIYFSLNYEPSDSEMEKVRKVLDDYIPKSMVYKINFVNEIPLSQGNKFKLVEDKTVSDSK